MKTFSEYCFERLAEKKPFGWPDELEKSLVTDADIEAVEKEWGYHFPEEFKEFLKSYILPKPTILYGEFTGDWYGAGMSYSFELEEYLDPDEIPEDQEICILEIVLEGLIGMADIAGHSLKENIERLSWTETAPLGYIYLGEFIDIYMFLECETGEIVCIDHDFYTISEQKEIDNIKQFKTKMFQNFHEMLKCLFLGAVCNGETAQLCEADEEESLLYLGISD